MTGRASAVTGTASLRKTPRSGVEQRGRTRRGGVRVGVPVPAAPQALPSTAHCVMWPRRQDSSRHRRGCARGAGGGGCQDTSARPRNGQGHTAGRGAGIRLSSQGNRPFAPHGASPTAQPAVDTESWNYFTWKRPWGSYRAP